MGSLIIKDAKKGLVGLCMSFYKKLSMQANFSVIWWDTWHEPFHMIDDLVESGYREEFYT